VYQSDKIILKKQLRLNQESLWREKSKIEWLKGKISVPDIVDYDVDELYEYLIITRLSGKDAAQTKWLNDPTKLVIELARALRYLHDHVQITNCPFDMRLRSKFKEVTDRLQANTSADSEKILHELITTAPDEDLVFTHGDYCLPNILIDEETCKMTGFVDLGRAGIADRYYDLALCLRSIQYNMRSDYSEVFRQAYGLFFQWNEKKINFYQKLEDFL
jgi:aminoglycoside phosphotransferase